MRRSQSPSWYVADLDGVFVLGQLDVPAARQESRVFRDGRRRVTAAAVGLMVGLVFAAIAQRMLPAPAERPRIRNIHDDRLPTYSPRYLRDQLRERYSG